MMSNPMKDPLSLAGVIVPMLTPFRHEDGDLDIPALRTHVEALVQAGVHGVIADAGGGEFYHMDESERRLCAETVVDQVRGRIPVLVGVGAPGNRLSVKYARHAQEAGANGLMLMAPFYSTRSWGESVLQHYVAVSDAVDLPIMLYNNPFATQVPMTADNMAKIVESANVPWIKLTTKQAQDVPDVIARIGSRARVFEAFDPISLFSIMNGAVGFVSVPANAIPDLFLKLWKLAYIERDYVSALELHHAMNPMLSAMLSGGAYVAALKELSRLRGIPQGAVRHGFRELTDGERSQVRRFAADLGVLDQSFVPTPVA
jgi:4-hydroxy-tetrahydrodipicolinate synthase